ncbi:MAG: ATPase [Candidatus Methanoperedens sp.]|jgi:flagellar protein FlaH|nr:ATPase [Candidatus Methanoperedens sp.]PKL54028.1 MAG: ATPase [Candidatus Methanoperedenaceae archaeon HGW-Methanoperedenaceae-1]
MAGYSFKLDRDELSEMLGGSLPKGTMLLMTGPHGSGKSVLSQRFAYGLLDNKNTVTYISTQLTTKNFIRQMVSLDYSIGLKMLRGELLYIPVYPLLDQTKPRMDFIGKLMSAEGLFEKDIIIIDNLSALIRYNINSERSLDLISFFKKLTGMQKTIILTMDSSELPESLTTEFKDGAEILLSLKIRQMGSETLRTAIIDKYTLQENQTGSMVGFKVETKMGIQINISGVS